MRLLKDSLNNEWEIDLNLGNAEIVENFLKENYEVNLWSAVETMGLLARPVPCVCLASLLCKQQRDSKGFTPEDFGRAWKGEHAYKLQRALWDEYREFFPDPFVAKVIDSTLNRLNESREREALLLTIALTNLADKRDQALDLMAKSIGKSSGDLSDSLGSESGQDSNTANSHKSPRRGTKVNGRKSR